MMVGLPGAGKSIWAERHCTMNPDKKYVILSTNNILNRIKVNIKQRENLLKISFVYED
jgi:heterogeneous nuclear ribonucleoprotein U-like protein 1